MDNQIPEDVYEGELISYPGPWAFQLPHAGIILVTDQELVDMANDPDKIQNLATGFQPREVSLRQVCEQAKSGGARVLKFAFDHFFQQYRPGTDVPRTLTPDMDEYVDLVAKISRFASDYGLRMELSLLSPLEIGPAYENATGESGRWMHYRKGLRDPETGAFSVQLWQHQRWVNNKGPIDLEPEDVRVFAFHEETVGGTPYRVVDPDSIVEISEVAKIEIFEGIRAGAVGRRIRVFGEGLTDTGNLDRVLVVQCEAEEKTAGGIVLPDSAQEKPHRGKVVAVGTGKLLDSGERGSMSVRVGDEVFYGKYAGSDVEVGTEKYVILKESDILAIIDR